MKSTFLIILLIFILPDSFSQERILTGTWSTGGLYMNPPKIILYSDSTFGYTAPLDVGSVPETKGKYLIKNDSIFFNYPNKIHPQIESITLSSDSKTKLNKVIFNAKFIRDSSRRVSPMHLYFNDTFSNRYKDLGYAKNKDTLIINQFSPEDVLFIHFNMYSVISCNLDFQKSNVFRINILLPELPTIYFLNSNCGVFRNGLLYIDYDGNYIPYYNITVNDTKKKRKKILEQINNEVKN
jgi:hypothetical protein